MNKETENIIAWGLFGVGLYLFFQKLSENQKLVVCSNCGTRIIANISLGGQIVCPNCQTKLLIQ